MVGGSSYHRVNGGPWQKDGEGLSSDSLSVFHRMPEPLMMGSSAKDLRLIGRDVVGGVATFLYELQFHPGQVSNRDSVLRIWIGIDDGLPRRFQLRMAEGNYKTPTISDEITTCLLRGGARDQSPDLTRQQENQTTESVSGDEWIALIPPVSRDIVCDVEGFEVGEAEGAEGIVGGLEVGAVVPGAAAAVDNDEFVARKRLHAIAQFREGGGVGGGTEVLGVGDVSLDVEHVKADLDEERFVGFGRCEESGEFVGLDEMRSGDGAGLKGGESGDDQGDGGGCAEGHGSHGLRFGGLRGSAHLSLAKGGRDKGGATGSAPRRSTRMRPFGALLLARARAPIGPPRSFDSRSSG